MAGYPGLMQASAQIITPMAKAWLATSQRARILHSFDHACNLVNEYNDVLALVSSEIEAGPFHVVLVNPLLPFEIDYLSPFIAIDMPATNIDIDMQQAVEWNPGMDWAVLQAHTAVWLPYIPQIQTMVQNYRAEMGLDTAVWQPKLADGLQQLLAGIAAEDTAVIQVGATQLAGLGPGLTPAGDDILLGVILGLWATWPGRGGTAVCGYDRGNGRAVHNHSFGSLAEGGGARRSGHRVA
ncbi:MAG: DUF2877 domain-containing protein [Anaerolineae bacterium]|nr:DUF2877 domain-containing protein [Anaerolineae bacterium]